MNVLHIISSLNIGGAENLVANLCLESTPFSLYLIANSSGVLQNKVDSSRCKFFIIEKGKFGLVYMFKLRKYIRKNNIQVIHLHDSLNVIYAFFATRFMRKKIVFTIHGAGKRKLKYFAMRIADSLILVSKYLKDHINPGMPEKEHVIYNGIIEEQFQHKISPLPSVKREISLLGMVGNFKNEARNQMTICRALLELQAKEIQFKFWFIGEKSEIHPEYFDECYNFCEENGLLDTVSFLGSRNDIPELLNKLDLFIYSSNQETFCLSVVEAMMSGTPVIVNDLPVFQEITDNGNYAQLYKTKDADDLAEKIEYFIRHPEARAELGERGRQYALENFTIEKHIEQLHSIYTELLSD